MATEEIDQPDGSVTVIEENPDGSHILHHRNPDGSRSEGPQFGASTPLGEIISRWTAQGGILRDRRKEFPK
jgi:hypothetical protein